MHIESLKPRDKLSLKPITSPLRKKYKTTFRSHFIDLEEDEEWTCLDKMGGGGGEESQNNALRNMEEKLKPNLD